MLDGIIVGGSSLEHVTDNLDALQHGPLDPSKNTSSVLALHNSYNMYHCILKMW